MYTQNNIKTFTPITPKKEKQDRTPERASTTTKIILYIPTPHIKIYFTHQWMIIIPWNNSEKNDLFSRPHMKTVMEYDYFGDWGVILIGIGWFDPHNNLSIWFAQCVSEPVAWTVWCQQGPVSGCHLPGMRIYSDTGSIHNVKEIACIVEICNVNDWL